MKLPAVLAVMVLGLNPVATCCGQDNQADTFATAGFRCLTEMPPSRVESPQANPPPRNSLQPLRTYRLAVAASGEYTEFHGGTIDDALRAITNVVSHLNEIFYREMGIRFALVESNSLVVFTNKDTDPFSINGPASITIDEAQRAFDEKLGTNNYDLGILLNTGTYGLAELNSVCDSQYKGSACMGLPEPDGEKFFVFVAHEIAHQFGAAHTFNDNSGFCSGNRNPNAAVEPGTGTTLMSYAGLGCGGNLLPYMNDYFHAKSLEEMRTFIDDTTLCGTFALSSNHIPFVQTAPYFLIPKLTPFKLTARGVDSDGDAMTYCWEELDLGPPQPFGEPDNGSSPLFRSLPPGPDATRFFPKLEAILSNTNSPGETLPALNRLMHFRVTVRDEREMGASNFADAYVEVSGTAGPFRVLSHNKPDVIHGWQIVRWDPAGTADSPVNITRVNVMLSTNGGLDFPIVLVTNTPNDGARQVVFPNMNADHVRIKVEAVDNIFFDINDADLMLIAGPVFTSITPDGEKVVVRWTRNSGKNYKLESAADLNPPDWQPVDVPLVRDGDEMEATVPLAGSPTFFRVHEY